MARLTRLPRSSKLSSSNRRERCVLHVSCTRGCFILGTQRSVLQIYTPSLLYKNVLLTFFAKAQKSLTQRPQGTGLALALAVFAASLGLSCALWEPQNLHNPLPEFNLGSIVSPHVWIGAVSLRLACWLIKLEGLSLLLFNTSTCSTHLIYICIHIHILVVHY